MGQDSIRFSASVYQDYWQGEAEDPSGAFESFVKL
jgi:hypothetical protein